MIIGLDFDNTIVSYDLLFHKVALEQGAIPDSVPKEKNAVRDFLRQAGKEAVWTEMQGTVYGARMDEAEPYPGALEVIAGWKSAGHCVVIVSHKTRYPFLGEKHDLHAAARHWLEIQGFFNPNGIGMTWNDAFFEVTKEEKLGRVKSQGCEVFVDDLPEILEHPAFPNGVRKFLFDPNQMHGNLPHCRIKAWSEADAVINLDSAVGRLREAQEAELQADCGIPPSNLDGTSSVLRADDASRIKPASCDYRPELTADSRFNEGTP